MSIIAKINRNSALANRHGKFYCGCDRAFVFTGQKCPRCKRRPSTRRLKGVTRLTELGW